MNQLYVTSFGLTRFHPTKYEETFNHCMVIPNHSTQVHKSFEDCVFSENLCQPNHRILAFSSTQECSTCNSQYLSKYSGTMQHE